MREKEKWDRERELLRVVWSRVLQTIERLPMLLSLGRSVSCEEVNVHTEFRRAVLAMTKEHPKNEMRLWMTEGVISPRARLGYWRGRELLNVMSVAHMTDIYALFPYPKCMMHRGSWPLHCLHFLPELHNDAESMRLGESDEEDSASESFDEDGGDEETDSASEMSEVENAMLELDVEEAKIVHRTKWQKVMESLLKLMESPFSARQLVPQCRRPHHRQRTRGRAQGEAYRNVAEYVAEIWYNTDAD